MQTSHRTVVIGFSIIATLLSGCLGLSSGTPVSMAQTDAGGPCTAPDQVIHHLPGGVPAAASAEAPVGCLYPTGYDSWEPTIGILSDGTVFIGPGAHDFPDNFITGGEVVQVGVLRSRDEGADWDLVFPSVAGVPTHQASLDPYLYVDPGTDRVWHEDLSHAVNFAVNSWSDDAGATWTHGLAGGVQTDHVTVFAGPPVFSPTYGYPNLVHRCGMGMGATNLASAAVVCQRSLTGGSTWLPHGEPAYTFLPRALHIASQDAPLQACQGGNGHGLARDDGRIYLPRGHCGQPYIAWSDDEGATWTRQQIADNGMACPGANEISFALPLPCADAPAIGLDAAGVLYAAWVAADHLPYLARSHDGGDTWDEPLMIAAPGLNEVALIKLAAGGAGEIVFVYYGTANSPGAPWTGDYAPTTWHAFMATSPDAQAARPAFATIRLNPADDPMVRGPCGPLRCDGAYDFIDIRIASDGTAWAPFVDACQGACVATPGSANNSARVLAARLTGVDLWDASDPNGPYP